MTYTEYIRSVEIASGMENVTGYAGNPLNLPHWTRFFHSVTETPEREFEADTPLGRAIVAIRQTPSGATGARLTIVSRFAHQSETADLLLTPTGDGTRVDFHIRLPKGLPSERRDVQLGVLEAELAQLAHHITDAGVGHQEPRISS